MLASHGFADAGGDANGPARLRKLGQVVQQVGDHLNKARRIDVEHAYVMESSTFNLICFDAIAEGRPKR